MTETHMPSGTKPCDDCGGNGYDSGVMPPEDMRGEYDTVCLTCMGKGRIACPWRCTRDPAMDDYFSGRR